MMNILVTGGTRGIGRGIVNALLEAGHRVGYCGRGATVEENRPDCAYFQCDVACDDARRKLVEDFLARFGSLDMLVNNAGVAPETRADLLDMSQESFERVLAIDLEGPFFLTQLAARAMLRDAGCGQFRCIVNIGSVSADYASINRGEYCLAKAAVAMSTRLFAVRLADAGIAVYEVRPGVIRSDMTQGVAERYDRLIADGLTLQKRWGEPADIGRAVAMLASGALAYSTGQVIRVDGGLSVKRF